MGVEPMCRYFFYLITKFIIVKDERGMLDVCFKILYFTYQTRQDPVTIICVTINTKNIHHNIIYTNAQE